MHIVRNLCYDKIEEMTMVELKCFFSKTLSHNFFHVIGNSASTICRIVIKLIEPVVFTQLITETVLKITVKCKLFFDQFLSIKCPVPVLSHLSCKFLVDDGWFEFHCTSFNKLYCFMTFCMKVLT